jgi:hypothetical protein
VREWQSMAGRKEGDDDDDEEEEEGDEEMCYLRLRLHLYQRNTLDLPI